MNDIAKPIMNAEKCLRRISDQIAHGTMTPTQVRLTHEAVMDALANLLEARKWTVDYLAKHTAQHGPSVQHSETRYVDEDGYSHDWSQECPQSGQDIVTLKKELIQLQCQVWNKADQPLQLQTPIRTCAGEEQDNPLDGVIRPLQSIRELPQDEKAQKELAQLGRLHVATRSLKVD